MKWLYKLEYKHGNKYIRRLMLIIIIGMVAVYFISMAAASQGFNFTALLTLNRDAIFAGQVWRLITFVFVPPGGSGIFWFIIAIYFYYMIGTSLESIWGGFRFNIYYLFGILGAIVACLLVGSATNTYLNLSLFLAFAALAPDTTFRLFFIIPIKAKWMAIAYAAFLVIQIIFAFISGPYIGLTALVSLALSLVNFAIFFGRSSIEAIQNQIRIYKNRRNWRR